MDEYTSEDWKKFQAAVSVLKSPILGESVELEPSAIGEYLHSEYVRSHSTPNISEITELPDSMPPGRQYTSPATYFVFPSPIGDDNQSTSYAGNHPGSVPLAVPHNRWRRKSEPSNTPTLDTKLGHSNNLCGDERLAEWVADLPEHGYCRARALTAPSHGTVKEVGDMNTPGSETGVWVSNMLPRDLNLKAEASPDSVASRIAHSNDEIPTALTTQKSPTKRTPKKEKRPSRQQSSSSSRVSESSSLGLPGLIRLHMDTIQKGELGKVSKTACIHV